jgi:hypothetical protein
MSGDPPVLRIVCGQSRTARKFTFVHSVPRTIRVALTKEGRNADDEQGKSGQGEVLRGHGSSFLVWGAEGTFIKQSEQPNLAD